MRSLWVGPSMSLTSLPLPSFEVWGKTWLWWLLMIEHGNYWAQMFTPSTTPMFPYTMDHSGHRTVPWANCKGWTSLCLYFLPALPTFPLSWGPHTPVFNMSWECVAQSHCSLIYLNDGVANCWWLHPCHSMNLGISTLRFCGHPLCLAVANENWPVCLEPVVNNYYWGEEMRPALKSRGPPKSPFVRDLSIIFSS